MKPQLRYVFFFASISITQISSAVLPYTRHPMYRTSTQQRFHGKTTENARSSLRNERLYFLSQLLIKGITPNRVNENVKALAYLIKYDYISVNDTYDDSRIRIALRRFQALYRIPVTGNLTKLTLEYMNESSCGNTGSYTLSERRKRYAIKTTSIRGKEYPVNFKKRFITYKILNYSSDINEVEMDYLIKDAYDRWSRVTSLIFEHSICDDVDTVIYFATRKHGNCRQEFDGAGNTLAHAYPWFSGCERCADIHIDDDESWGKDGKWGSLAATLTHEIGHTLGLVHSEIRASLMFKMLVRPEHHAELHRDDIAGIQSLYGDSNSIYNYADDTDKPLERRCVKAIDGIKPSPTPLTESPEQRNQRKDDSNIVDMGPSNISDCQISLHIFSHGVWTLGYSILYFTAQLVVS